MIKRTRSFVVVLTLFSALVGACSHTPAPPLVETPEPYLSAKASPVDDLRFLGPQPTEADLKALASQGVSTVINFRRPEEMENLEFDEAQILASQSIQYVQIPIGRGQYSPVQLTQLSDALAQADSGKILLHCGSGWRASEVLVAHLVENEGWELNEALKHAIGWWPLALEQVTEKRYRLDTATP
ncbi:MAG: sulfur transferase domain-containing protein [Pseudomonadota bacterium]